MATEGSGGTGGVVLPMTMSGDGFLEAIYSVLVSVGSNGASFEMQVDIGSSDAWLASSSCKSTPCQHAGTSLYDWSSTTVDSGSTSDITYLVGYVQGPIVWENFQFGNYTIANQAMLSGVQVENERLSSHFVGLLGLALQPNSILATHFRDILQFPTSTFASNIFTSATPPANRTIGIALERPGQSNSGTPSLLSVGSHPSSLVPDPSKIAYTPLNGNMFWRVPVTQITAWIPGEWSKGGSNLGAYGAGEAHSLTLARTFVSGAQSIWPLAILDTGGARIITSRYYANMFWGTYGVAPASDGMYYVPCSKPLNVTIQIGSVDYAIHPLDMSYISSADPGSGNCVGAWQASDQLAAADLVLGAAFMRNVYTVLQYDAPITGVAQRPYVSSNARPELGLLPLTNWEVALQDFYRVRELGQPLEDSSSSSGSGSGSSGGGSSSGAGGVVGGAEGEKKMSVGVMALIGILAFFGIAAGLFMLRWWMMKRRWRRMREAAIARGEPVDSEKDVVEGVAIPRPKKRDQDEAYERAHSAAYDRSSAAWDPDTGTIVGSSSSRTGVAKGNPRRKPGKTNSFGASKVGLMGEWVEPDSDEEEADTVPARTSMAGGNSGDRESWAAVRPREVRDIDVLDRANRAMSFAGVGAGETVQFVSAESEYGRPLSMPLDISQVAAMPGGITAVSNEWAAEGRGMNHRQTYSRTDSEGGTVTLLDGTRSPLRQTSFALDDSVRPTSQYRDVDPLTNARRSVDVGPGAVNERPSLPRVHISSWGSALGDTAPVNRGSMDIASPRSHADPRSR
ncbi:acid protease [Ceratobasidium sp. AG-I]|nr:acid protease [Ceratobasidium sp. AG-I]